MGSHHPIPHGGLYQRNPSSPLDLLQTVYRMERDGKVRAADITLPAKAEVKNWTQSLKGEKKTLASRIIHTLWFTVPINHWGRLISYGFQFPSGHICNDQLQVWGCARRRSLWQWRMALTSVCVWGRGAVKEYNKGICAHAAFLLGTVITVEALGYKSSSLSNNIWKCQNPTGKDKDQTAESRLQIFSFWSYLIMHRVWAWLAEIIKHHSATIGTAKEKIRALRNSKDISAQLFKCYNFFRFLDLNLFCYAALPDQS